MLHVYPVYALLSYNVRQFEYEPSVIHVYTNVMVKMYLKFIFTTKNIYTNKYKWEKVVGLKQFDLHSQCVLHDNSIILL